MDRRVAWAKPRHYRRGATINSVDVHARCEGFESGESISLGVRLSGANSMGNAQASSVGEEYVDLEASLS